MDDAQRTQRLRLTIGLAAMILILSGTVACGSRDGSLAKGGIAMVVVSGQARLQSGERNALAGEGQEAVVTVGDQITADEAGVELLLANGSLLHLSPGTELQVVAFSAEGAARLSQSKGRLEVKGASPLLTVEVSISASEGFALKTLQLTVTPTGRDTSFGLGIDGFNAHLTVEAGEVNVAHEDSTAIVAAGSEVKARPDEDLIVSQAGVTAAPPATATPTAGLTPTVPSGPTPSSTATVYFLHSAPGLVGPADGSEFKPDETILLIWNTPTPLSENEWYEVQLWKEGEVPYRVVQWVKEGAWKVEPMYYPGRYQWRILIVRGREGRKEMDLSPPSQTWSFGWLRPSAPISTVPTSPPGGEATVDFTVYLRNTNNAQGFATFSGEHVNAGTIYSEGGTVYGDVAVRIGGTEYHFDKEPGPGEPEQLPAPYRMEFKFSDSLLATTEGIKPGFNPQKAQFWVGTLNCNSATPSDRPYQIAMTLYAGVEIRKHTEISFLVADAPLCGAGGKEPEEGGGGGPTPPPRP